MKKLLFAAVAITTVAFTAPASAQFGMGAGPGGVGVQVGPVGAGVGPGYGWGHRDRWDRSYHTYGYDRSYGGDCRVMRQRIVTSSGRRIIRTQRVCD
jgi:hypothetical protein